MQAKLAFYASGSGHLELIDTYLLFGDPATAPATAIDAVDDSGATLNGATGGTSITNVLGNDTLNGGAANTSNVTITAVGAWPTGISLNTSKGAVNVAAGTASNTYTAQYQILRPGQFNRVRHCHSDGRCGRPDARQERHRKLLPGSREPAALFIPGDEQWFCGFVRPGDGNG